MVLYFISFYLINKFLFLRGCFLILVFLRRVSKSESEDDDFCSHKEKNCLMLLKVFETLSLQVQASPGKELENDIPPSVARVPKLYSPVLAAPSTSSSKGEQKHEKQIEEDTKSNNEASSVLRPRAVLSSPDNDGMIGHINRLSRVLPSVMKKKDLGEKTCVPGKVNPRCVKAKSPVNTRRKSKETSETKVFLNITRSPDLTAPKQKSGPRKVKASS
ncbi:uncharacterized protein LOC113333687 isoform X2 [Papaver somniferum]|uniref:uncharacterized protein LOC113333687 isoform X2 n=2 Tax=Papaver somniferum TaxID=3469 RepID=UPI000E6F59B7|nr:uncharacterized protein LOC113333687 isoform X2 [Papaver somniferum]